MKNFEKHREKHILSGNKRLVYMDEGKGSVIFLLHGYLESLSIWDDFVQGLTGEYRIIRPDLPGHGSSELSGEIQTMEDSVTAIKSLADKLKLEKFFLAGHSLGGYVALSFLESYPQYLEGFCLFHSHPLPDSEEVKKKRQKEIKLVQAGKKELIYNVNIPNAFASDNLKKFKNEIEFAKLIARDTPDEGIVSTLKGMMLRKDMVNMLAATDIPFLWILGRKDNYIPYNEIRTKIKMPVKGSLVTLMNSGHQGFIEEKELSLQLFKDWMKNT